MVDSGGMLPENILDLIPHRTCRWYRPHRTGLYVIRKRRFPLGSSLYQRIFMKLLNRDDFVKIHLDEYGSSIFGFIDGKKNVRDIGEKVREKFGKDVEPVYPRMAAFLTNMDSNGIIRLEPVIP